MRPDLPARRSISVKCNCRARRLYHPFRCKARLSLWAGSGTSRAEGRCDLPDGFHLAGTDALPSLPMDGGHLAGQGDDEAPVVITFLGGGPAIDQGHRIADVPEPVVPEFFSRVVPGVVHLGLG